MSSPVLRERFPDVLEMEPRIMYSAAPVDLGMLDGSLDGATDGGTVSEVDTTHDLNLLENYLQDQVSQHENTSEAGVDATVDWDFDPQADQHSELGEQVSPEDDVLPENGDGSSDSHLLLASADEESTGSFTEADSADEGSNFQLASQGSELSESLDTLAGASQPPSDLSSGIELNTDGGNDAYLVSSEAGAILGGLPELTVDVQFAIDSINPENTLVSYATLSDDTSEPFKLIVWPDGGVAQGPSPGPRLDLSPLLAVGDREIVLPIRFWINESQESVQSAINAANANFSPDGYNTIIVGSNLLPLQQYILGDYETALRGGFQGWYTIQPWWNQVVTGILDAGHRVDAVYLDIEAVFGTWTSPNPDWVDIKDSVLAMAAEDTTGMPTVDYAALGDIHHAGHYDAVNSFNLQVLQQHRDRINEVLIAPLLAANPSLSYSQYQFSDFIAPQPAAPGSPIYHQDIVLGTTSSPVLYQGAAQGLDQLNNIAGTDVIPWVSPRFDDFLALVDEAEARGYPGVLVWGGSDDVVPTPDPISDPDPPTNPTDAFSISLLSDGTGLVQLHGSQSVVLSGMDYTTLMDGALHSLSFTWDSATGDWAVYADGMWIEAGTNLGTGQTLLGEPGNGTLVLGQEQDSLEGGFDPAQTLQGRLYDVRIWNESRSEAQVTLSHQQKFDTGSLPAGLVANWQMDGFNGSAQVVDVVGGRNLSVGHAADPGFTPSTPVQDLHVAENSTSGTSVGFVVPSAPEAPGTLLSDGQFLSLGRSEANSLALDPQAILSNFTFRLIDDAGGRFAIDASSGEITVANGSLLDYESSTAHSVTVEVADLEGKTYSEAMTIQIDDLYENNDPVLAFGGGNVSYVEDQAPILIDATATVSDVDLMDFAGGVLTVELTVNAEGTDRLAIHHEGMGLGQIGVTAASNQLFFSGALIGTWSSSGPALAITFNHSADAAAVQAVARKITFENTSQAPSTSARTVRFQLTDGDGGSSAAITKEIAVAGVNDPPLTASDSYSTSNQLALAVPAPGVLANDFDPDSPTLTVELVTPPEVGTLTLNGDGSFVYTPEDTFAGSVTFTYRVFDGAEYSGEATVTITTFAVPAEIVDSQVPGSNNPPFESRANETIFESTDLSLSQLAANDLPSGDLPPNSEALFGYHLFTAQQRNSSDAKSTTQQSQPEVVEPVQSATEALPPAEQTAQDNPPIPALTIPPAPPVEVVAEQTPVSPEPAPAESDPIQSELPVAEQPVPATPLQQTLLVGTASSLLVGLSTSYWSRFLRKNYRPAEGAGSLPPRMPFESVFTGGLPAEERTESDKP